MCDRLFTSKRIDLAAGKEMRCRNIYRCYCAATNIKNDNFSFLSEPNKGKLLSQ